MEKRESRDSEDMEAQGISLEEAQREILKQKLAGRDRRFFLIDPAKKQKDDYYAHSGFVTIRAAHLFTPAVLFPLFCYCCDICHDVMFFFSLL